MIRTWFGQLPDWTDEFVDSVLALATDGWDFLLFTDPDEFKERGRKFLGVDVAVAPGTRKAGDFDPFLGLLFQDKLRGYDMWGHFNLDAVYGRLSSFLPDSFLSMVDIYGDDPGAICGPFSVYCNDIRICELALRAPNAERNLTSPAFFGWDEQDFSEHVVRSSLRGEIRFASGFMHTHDHISERHAVLRKHCVPAVAFEKHSGALIDLVYDKEVMFYHFNQDRRWPIDDKRK